jgi:hypothetical protein
MMVFLCWPWRLPEANLNGSVCLANLMRSVTNSQNTLSRKKHRIFTPMSLSDWKTVVVVA